MQNPKCDKLIVAPGNAGIAQIAECATLDIENGAAVVNFCEGNAIDFVIIGPEAPLAAGVGDRLRDAGLLVFGRPRRRRLEASKSFTKADLRRRRRADRGLCPFHRRRGRQGPCPRQGAPIVVKADGLAAGKGVIVAETVERREEAIDDMFGGAFGGAGAEVVIEEFMAGEEASFFVLCDGETPCPSAPRRTTSASAKATPAPTPAAWAPIPPPRC